MARQKLTVLKLASLVPCEFIIQVYRDNVPPLDVFRGYSSDLPPRWSSFEVFTIDVKNGTLCFTII